jgi:hypothetical protein
MPVQDAILRCGQQLQHIRVVFYKQAYKTPQLVVHFVVCVVADLWQVVYSIKPFFGQIKYGYNAPIVVTDKKYYSYEDPDYSITHAPVNQADVDKMKEVVGVLKQPNGFNYFDEMSDLIARLENSVYRNTHEGANYIQFENNHLVKGIEHVTPLYQCIINKKVLEVAYKSFKAAQSQQIICYPYLLKEYRNRWFLIARSKKKRPLLTMALDRIIQWQEQPKEKFIGYKGPDFDAYFNNLIGVTKNETDQAQKVVLFVNKFNAPYVLTKPIHPSQIVLKEDAHGIMIRIEVVVNFELEREILGFGECMKVVAPKNLANRIKKRLEKGMRQYEESGQLNANEA